MRAAPTAGFDTSVAQCFAGFPAPGDLSLACTNAKEWPQVYVKYNTTASNAGIVGSYRELYKQSTEPILAFIHDDVIIRERGWDERIIEQFEKEERVALVGFGGARWHGIPDLYKVPYHLPNLKRGDYLSNVDDAEVHGTRFTGEADVAVLDGFCLIARRDFLDSIGGFASFKCDFFCYDYTLCALARRAGYRIRCVGVRCHHRGGGTSVTEAPDIVNQDAYNESHRWFFEEFRDVMPWRVHADSP
jgi:GT2 family glycosyltransferase